MSWKEQRRAYLDNWYRKYAEEWKDEKDDRRLYSNMFFHMYEAIESLDDEPHIYVKVAMNHKISEELKIMDEIKEHFNNKKAV